MARRILVTGAAGFVGSHTIEAFLARGDMVVGVDNFHPYYDPARKRANLAEAVGAVGDSAARFRFVEGDLCDEAVVRRLFDAPFDAVVHLAAMAGVRASIERPQLYVDVNVSATLRLLDASVGRLGHGPSERRPTFVFASTSSAYGATTRIPFVEDDPCNGPLAPYAATKRAAELLGFTYHRNFGLPFTALRFFTVYGPRNRPDMMAYKVIDNLFFGREVPLFNGGRMYRDWTYVGDIVQGIVAAADRPLGCETINLGRGEPVSLGDFVAQIERLTGRTANLTPAPAPDTDMISTHADITKATRLLGYRPTTSVPEGAAQLWAWYRRAVLDVTAR